MAQPLIMSREDVQAMQDEHQRLREQFGTFTSPVTGRGAAKRSLAPPVAESEGLWGEFAAAQDDEAKNAVLRRIQAADARMQPYKAAVTAAQQATVKANKRLFSDPTDRRSYEEQVESSNKDRKLISTGSGLFTKGENGRTARDRYFHKLSGLEGYAAVFAGLIELLGTPRSNDAHTRLAFEKVAKQMNREAQASESGRHFHVEGMKDGGSMFVCTDKDGNPTEMPPEMQADIAERLNAELAIATKGSAWSRGLSYKLTGPGAKPDASASVGGPKPTAPPVDGGKTPPTTTGAGATATAPAAGLAQPSSADEDPDSDPTPQGL